MKGLRLMVVLLAVALALAFASTNWQPVEVRIWPGLIWETKLPVPVIGAFLAGLLPVWLVYRAKRWRLLRRITNLEASLASMPLANANELANSRGQD